jgi:hypothetical protein
LFYTNKQQPVTKSGYSIEWLLKGEIDKPVYFVTKITSIENVKANYSDLREIYRKNGFVFLLRKPL